MNSSDKNEGEVILLYIITGLQTGGAEIMLYNILQGINREKFIPHVISLAGNGPIADRIKSLGIPVYSLHLPPGKMPSIKTFFRLVKLVGKIRPAIIQGWMYHGNIAAQLASFFISRNVPVFWNIQHSVESIVREKRSTQQAIRFGAWLSRFPRKIVYVSQTGKRQHESLGYAEKKGCVITNAVDTEKFIPSENSRSSFRRQMQLPGDVVLVGLFARYHPMKDHENFLQAAALVQVKHSGVHFILSGTNIDHENERLNAVIRQLGISHIVLLGEQSNMQSLIAAMDIVVVSSSFGEASPVVLLESMSCGVPCISTDVGDAKLIIGDTGIVVSPQDAPALAGALDELLSGAAEKRLARGTAARERIRSAYSLGAVIKQYEKLYCDKFF